jgi:hypothetical protein
MIAESEPKGMPFQFRLATVWAVLVSIMVFLVAWRGLIAIQEGAT